MVGFPSLAGILGDFLLLFFEVKISSHTLIPLFMPESVNSGSVSQVDCGRMFPVVRVSCFENGLMTG